MVAQTELLNQPTFFFSSYFFLYGRKHRKKSTPLKPTKEYK